MLYLTVKDQQDAYFDARKHFDASRQPVDQAAALQFHQEYTYQLAYRMLLKDENPENKLFASIDELRRKCTSNDVDWFVALQEKQFTEELLRWRSDSRPLVLAELAEAAGCDRTLSDDEIISRAARKLRTLTEAV